MSIQTPRTKAQTLAMSGITTARSIKLHIGQLRNALRLHIQRRAERTTAVGRRTYAALQLDATQGRRKIAHIHPINLVAFCIIERNTIGRNVDTRWVCAAHTQVRIADAYTGIARSRHARCQGQESRHIFPKIECGKILFRQVGKSYGGLPTGSRRRNLHFLQTIGFQRVAFIRESATGSQG